MKNKQDVTTYKKKFQIKNCSQTIETESEDKTVNSHADDYLQEDPDMHNCCYRFVRQRKQVLSIKTVYLAKNMFTRDVG